MAVEVLEDGALDYYVIRGVPGHPDAVVVEEFMFADDFSSVRLRSAGWTLTSGQWTSSASLSRAMRADPAIREHVSPVYRPEAEVAFYAFGGGVLPDETTLRGYFTGRPPLASSPPLRLGPVVVPDGFRDRRVYRVLFAGGLDEDRLDRLRRGWRMEPSEGRGVLGTARLTLGPDRFTWDLRGIGPGVAWSLDVTALLGGAADTVPPLLRRLIGIMRQYGLIPVTVERFS